MMQGNKRIKMKGRRDRINKSVQWRENWHQDPSHHVLSPACSTYLRNNARGIIQGVHRGSWM